MAPEKRPTTARVAGNGIVANTAIVISEIFRSPRCDSAIIVSDTNQTSPRMTAQSAGSYVDENAVPGRDSMRTDGPVVRGSKPAVSENSAGPGISNDTKVLSVPATFKMVFITVTAITLIAGTIELVLASIWPNPTANQQSAFEAIGFAWKAGVGAIFGLLGGKIN
jgi:hypothetical protein